jgi:accessory secretory protein Asp1
MLWFIPSWYKDESMNAMERSWNRKTVSSQFDDTVSQVKIFNEGNKDVSLMILSYTPQLRHFLYREEIMDVPYISIFDDLQDIHSKRIGLYSYKDLNWPKDIEWTYTPYIVLAKRCGKEFAKIYFGKEGYMIVVELCESNRKKLVFDDRGFVSSIQYFKEDAIEYIEYYNEKGEWQFRHDCMSDHVLINETQKHRFRKMEYNSMDEVMKEYLQMKLHHFSFEDIVVIASDEHHNEMLMQSIWKQKIILSLFGDRFDIHKGGHVYHKADIVLTDSDEKKHIIEEEFRVHNVYTVSPFDTRFQLGQSQRTKKHKIYFPIDDIQIELKALEDIIEYMKSHPLVELYIGLYQFDHTFENTIYEIMNQLLRKCNAKMNIEVGIEKESSRIHLVPIISENDLISLFVDMRLIVDLREHPDTFTLIAGMSTGIPQIVKHENNYIHHKKNGLYLERGISLQESIRYYLEYLEHWNDSLVYSYSLMQEYTGEKILKKWKEMIKNESKY